MFSVCFWHFLSFESQNDVCIRSRRHSGRHGHASPPTGSAMSDGTLSERERLVYSAKLAEQAERYDGTSDGVVSFAANSPASRRDDRVPGVERGLGLAGRLDRVSPPRTWNSVPRRTCEVDESHNLGDRTRNGRVGAVPEGVGCILIFVIFLWRRPAAVGIHFRSNLRLCILEYYGIRFGSTDDYRSNTSR